MTIKRLTIESTIPTVQYGNVRTLFEGEIDEGETFEDVRNDILRETKKISDMVAGEVYTFDVRGLPVSQGIPQPEVLNTSTKQLTSELTGVSVFYNDALHAYTDAEGNKYLSGSKFPEKFYADFDSQMIIDKLVAKYPGMSGLEIAEMWKRNGEASTSLGSAVHAALENFDKHSTMGEIMGGDDANKALSKNFLIRTIVEKFHEGRGAEDVLSEAFVANEEFKLAGTIDRLLFVDREKKIVRVQDYKTDGNIQDKKYQVKDSPMKGKVPNTLLGYHLLQLSFYAFILKEAGYTVEGLDIFWLNTEKLVGGKENPWETFSHDVVDITETIKEK